MAKKQKIKCDVESCRHQNTDENTCKLDEIKVSCICDNEECECSDETVCESFESTEENIDDSDIEVEIDFDRE